MLDYVQKKHAIIGLGRHMPKPIPKIPSESVEQLKLVNLLRWQYPDVLFHSIPNGAKVHPATAARLKAEGMTAGVSDLFFAEPRGKYHGLYLEMKRKKGNSMSPKQHEWFAQASVRGYAVACGKGFEKALKLIEDYLAGRHDAFEATQEKYGDIWRTLAQPREVGS